MPCAVGGQCIISIPWRFETLYLIRYDGTEIPNLIFKRDLTTTAPSTTFSYRQTTIWPILIDINWVDKIIETPVHITQYNNTTAASKISIHLNQHLSKTISIKTEQYSRKRRFVCSDPFVLNRRKKLNHPKLKPQTATSGF